MSANFDCRPYNITNHALHEMLFYPAEIPFCWKFSIQKPDVTRPTGCQLIHHPARPRDPLITT
jgi:hypothetical protein